MKLLTTIAFFCFVFGVQTEPISFEFNAPAETNTEPADKEWLQNLDLLNEIQEKVNLLSRRMQKYQYYHPKSVNEKPFRDCVDNCNDLNHEKNLTDTPAVISISFGGFIFPDDIILDNQTDQNDQTIPADDQIVDAENEIVHYPIALPLDNRSDPKLDVEIFSPPDERKQASADIGNIDFDPVRNWVVASSDADRGARVFESNIFTNHGLEYPQIKIYDQDQSYDQEQSYDDMEQDMQKQEEQHRRRFDELFRSLFD